MPAAFYRRSLDLWGKPREPVGSHFRNTIALRLVESHREGYFHHLGKAILPFIGRK
jgi:hypothetical protein